ncbi:MAG TPA: hypothetical protein VFB12_13110 [Ktedonobacteraceae bacterium]|nr:hypothetical protein [Ktedonobacteraceae bacterium]
MAWTGPIDQDAGAACWLIVDVLRTSMPFEKLLMRAEFADGLGNEQGTAIALGRVAVGMGTLVGGMHTQPGVAARGAMRIRTRGGVGIERHSSDAPWRTSASETYHASKAASAAKCVGGSGSARTTSRHNERKYVTSPSLKGWVYSVSTTSP